MTTQPDAEAIARDLLVGALPRRWEHSRGVAAAARHVSGVLGYSTDFVAAAWLHDIGYAPGIAENGTGFHPLDGARYLRDEVRATQEVCCLVAHHSCAEISAGPLGLAAELVSEFPSPPVELADAMTYCDMTTGPDGHPVSFGERLAEIGARYGPGHIVTRTMTSSAPVLTAAIERATARLAEASAHGNDGRP